MTKRERYIVTIPIKNERGEVVAEIEAISLKGLVALGHEEGLTNVTTNVVQIPGNQNDHVAVVHAVVETRKGTFSGIGDASPGNVNRRVARHILRMAESRAVARALRLAVNVGEVSLEELADDVEDIAEKPTRGVQPELPTAPKTARTSGGNGAGGKAAGENGKTVDPSNRITSRQLAAIHASCRRLGLSRDDLAGIVNERFGEEKLELLSKAQASALLGQFNDAA